MSAKVYDKFYFSLHPFFYTGDMTFSRKLSVEEVIPVSRK